MSGQSWTTSARKQRANPARRLAYKEAYSGGKHGTDETKKSKGRSETKRQTAVHTSDGLQKIIQEPRELRTKKDSGDRQPGKGVSVNPNEGNSAAHIERKRVAD